MARAAADCLGDAIADGIVITKYDHAKGEIPHVRVREAGHPVPDQNSFDATAEAIALVEPLGAQDAVLLLISGGGSLLQDGTSKKSLFYYVTIMRMAKRAGLKLMLYANGLGPLVDSSSRKLAAEIMAKADYISLREDRSRQLARELGIPD